MHLLLKREHFGECRKLLGIEKSLVLSDFSLYSICILLSKLKEFEALRKFLSDIANSSNINIRKIHPAEFLEVIRIEEAYQLDFDDAYQYVLADRYGLTIVSYDSDFDRTPRGRTTPVDCLK